MCIDRISINSQKQSQGRVWLTQHHGSRVVSTLGWTEPQREQARLELGSPLGSWKSPPGRLRKGHLCLTGGPGQRLKVPSPALGLRGLDAARWRDRGSRTDRTGRDGQARQELYRREGRSRKEQSEHGSRKERNKRVIGCGGSVNRVQDTLSGHPGITHRKAGQSWDRPKLGCSGANPVLQAEAGHQ